MTPELRVLDANLRALLRRAWSPVRPADAFRRRLRVIGARLGGLAGASGRPTGRPGAPRGGVG